MFKELIGWAAHRYLGGSKSYFTPINAVHSSPGEIDFAQGVGTGYSSNVIMTPVGWVARNFNAAPLAVETLKGGQWSPLDTHAVLDLLARPNSWYTGTDLWDATVKSWFLDGNSYWIKVRDGSSIVRELWFVPPSMIEPRDDGPRGDGPAPFVTHYRYQPRGKVHQDLPIEDVVHFRCGLDPDNPRKGTSTLKTILREVFTDDEASRYTAFLLKNNGVPGLVISPTTDEPITDADLLKKQIDQRTTGPERGRAFVMQRPVKVEQFGFEPRRMDVSALRNVSEERACAAVGISPTVCHFGTGQESVKVGATLKLYKQMAWQDTIIPMQSRMADQLDVSVLAEFDSKPGIRLRFVTEDIPALQEDGDSLATRNTGLYRGGLLRRSEARTDLGWPVDSSDEGFVYELEPSNAAPVLKGTKQATAREQRAIDTAPIGDPTSEQERLMLDLDGDRLALEDSFATSFEDWASDFGDQIVDAAKGTIKSSERAIWQDEPASYPKWLNGSLHKAASDDAGEIIGRLDMAGVSSALTVVYEEQYLKVAASTYRVVGDSIGLVIGLPDDRSVDIVKAGGTRRGLIDIDKQTRARLFVELEKAREEGLGVIATERRIRELVPAGPHSSVKIRSRLIARTEVLNAQRHSLIGAYEDSGRVKQVMIFDNRTGFGDGECTALNRRIVSLSEAQGLANDEHPNGTRSFAPVV